MRIGFATRDWATDDSSDDPRLGGSGHYRCALPVRVLSDMGHEVVLGTLCARDRPRSELGVVTWDLEKHWGFDLMVLQRWMFEDLPDRIFSARATGQVVLNDVDDWWEGLDPTNVAWETSHPRTNRVENRDHYRRVLAASDAIVCSTPFLTERYRRLGRTVLVRNVLDLERWTVQEPRDEPPVLGWVGAIPWRSRGDLEALAGFLGPFLEKHDLRVLHAGAMAPGWDFAIATKVAPHRLVQTPLVPISEHESQFHGIDIALVPLANKPFNQAKSGLKGIQAAASGVPFVATDMPEYRWLATSGMVGRVAKNPHQWINHLEHLLDPAVRQMDSLVNAAQVQTFGLPLLARQWRVLLDALGFSTPSRLLPAGAPLAEDKRVRPSALILP